MVLFYLKEECTSFSGVGIDLVKKGHKTYPFLEAKQLRGVVFQTLKEVSIIGAGEMDGSSSISPVSEAEILKLGDHLFLTSILGFLGCRSLVTLVDDMVGYV